MNNLGKYFADNSHREVDVNAVAEAISTGSHTVLDVREQVEWDEAHIDGAVHIPLGDLVLRANELPAGTPIYTVCRSGARSLTAIDILDGAGLEGAKSLAGGVIGWNEAGKPLVR